MDTDYINFNYNNTFLYNYNIFKKNYNVGIGTCIPKHNLDIHGNLSSANNININAPLILDNTYKNGLTFLEYNTNTNQIQPIKFINQSNNITNNRYDWTNVNNDLKLDFHNKNDNTIIPFQSIRYKNTDVITLYSKYNITLTHAFIYNSLNTATIDNEFSIQNLSKDTNNTTYTYNLTKISDYYYKFDTNLILNKNEENLITINNSSTTQETSGTNYIILLGKYNFNPGLLWNSNTNNDLFIEKNNVGIGTTSIFNTQLYVNDSATLINAHIYNKVKAFNSTINTINNTGHSYIDQITSNKLSINKTNQYVGIGTNNTNDFLNLANEIIINHNKNTFINNLSFINNINFNNNINILHKNKPLIIFNNNNNEFTYKLNNIYKSTNKLYILNNLNVNNNVNNSNKISNDNNGILNINGNLTITENISIQGILKIKNLDNITFSKQLNVINFKNKNYLINKGFTYAKYIMSKTFKTHYLKTPYKSVTNQEGTFCYNPSSNTFIGNNGNNLEFLSNNDIQNRQDTFDYIFDGSTDLLYTTTKHINTNNINVNQKFILPKTNIYHTNLSNSINKSLIGNMRFNVNTLYTQVYNDKSWCSIKYNNSDSQLNYISFDTISDLQPSFHNRKFNYKYVSLNKPTFLTISINPYSSVNIIYKTDGVKSNESIINNTQSIHISKNIDIKTDIIEDFNSIDFISRKYNSNTNSINYTCSFEYISDQLENFIAKYEFFNIKILEGSLNVFKLCSSTIPTNLVYNNMFQPNLNSMQLIAGQNVYINNTITRFDIQNIKYYRDTRKFERNYFNKLYELNYNLVI